MRYRILFTLLVVHTGSQNALSHLPIVLITQSGMSALPMQELIYKYLPDAYVRTITLHVRSFWNIYDEARELIDAIYHDNALRHGFTIIAFGHAGLTARYYLERYNMPPVLTYIALGTPQRGVYGNRSTIDPHYAWLNSCEPHVSTILYLSLFQRYTVLAGYWNDPLCHDTYLANCCFLPYLNNEKEHEHALLFKHHLASLEAMVLIHGICDDTVEPSQSAHFGYFKQGTDEVIETIFESELYREDTLGLKILHETGRLHLRTGNCDHEDLTHQEENFVSNILPFLQDNQQKQPR